MGDDLNPRTIEQAESARRSFLKWLLGAIVFINGLVVGVPYLRVIFSRVKIKKSEWTEVAALSSLPVGRPKDLKFMVPTEDAYLRGTALRSVWAIRHSQQDVTIFSPICPHLGCYYKWDEQTASFECPCHASVYDINGKVLGGPAPRPLDTLPYKIEKGMVYVQWEQFKVGTPEKIPI